MWAYNYYFKPLEYTRSISLLRNYNGADANTFNLYIKIIRYFFEVFGFIDFAKLFFEYQDLLEFRPNNLKIINKKSNIQILLYTIEKY